MNETHKEWIKRITEGDTFREVGRKTGIHHSAITRSLNRNGLSTDQVVRIAHAYDANIVDALKETGIIQDRQKQDSPEDIANRIKQLADKLAHLAPRSNVEPLFDEITPEAPVTDYDHLSVAYDDDEDRLRGWDADD